METLIILQESKFKLHEGNEHFSIIEKHNYKKKNKNHTHHEVTFSRISQALMSSLNPSPVPQLYSRGLPLIHR